MFPKQPESPQPSTTTQPAPGTGLPPVLSHSGPVIPIDPNPPQLVPAEPTPLQPAAASVQQTDLPQPSMDAPGTPPALDNFSVDYLNQIAPKQQKTVNRFAVFGLIGGVLMALVVVLMVIANSGPPDISAQTKVLQQRIATLQSVADTQQPHLQNNNLSVANSTLSSTLTTMSTDLGVLMKAKNVKTSDKTAAATAAEKKYAAVLQKKLDDSYQRGTLDQTYAPQMVYELTVLRTKLKLLKSTSGSSKSVATFCDTSIENVDALLKAYRASTAPE